MRELRARRCSKRVGASMRAAAVTAASSARNCKPSQSRQRLQLASDGSDCLRCWLQQAVTQQQHTCRFCISCMRAQQWPATAALPSPRRHAALHVQRSRRIHATARKPRAHPCGSGTAQGASMRQGDCTAAGWPAGEHPAVHQLFLRCERGHSLLTRRQSFCLLYCGGCWAWQVMPQISNDTDNNNSKLLFGRSNQPACSTSCPADSDVVGIAVAEAVRWIVTHKVRPEPSSWKCAMPVFVAAPGTLSWRTFAPPGERFATRIAPAVEAFCNPLSLADPESACIVTVDNGRMRMATWKSRSRVKAASDHQYAISALANKKKQTRQSQLRR